MSRRRLLRRAWLVTVVTLAHGWLLAVPACAEPAPSPVVAVASTSPGTTAPDTTGPDTTEPGTTAPGTTSPGTTSPAVAGEPTPEPTEAPPTPTPEPATPPTSPASTSPTPTSPAATSPASTSPAPTTSVTAGAPAATSSPSARTTTTPTATRTPAAGTTTGRPATTARGTAGRLTVAGTTGGVPAPAEDPDAPDPVPSGSPGPDGAATADTVVVELDGLTSSPGTPVLAILGLTLISLAPAILLTCTSFTKILVVLGLTRNALGLQQTPPNQVLAGLALFLSLFVMAPVLGAVNETGLQPYLDGTKTSAQAFDDGVAPLREFMLDHTDDDELRLLTTVADRELPATRADVPMATLIPAFVLTELKEAFIIGFIIFVPFLVIDMVVGGALMALGMMMMPPVMVSLPFKLLLFVLVNGWGLVIESLVSSYR